MLLSLAAAGPTKALPNLFGHATKPPPSAKPVAQAPSPATIASPSDITADPAVRLGILSNGLRYAIVKTTGGAGRASVRLRFDVGANAEGPDEQGFAQLLSRLPFDHPAPPAKTRGSAKTAPPKFNADDNIDATVDATTFSLDLPTADEDEVDAALALMRSVVGPLKFSQADADAEWQAVLAHERTSNDVGYRLFKARLAFLLEGQRPALGYVGGKINLPAKVRRNAVEAFHARYYRPENAVLVVAGDVDPGATETSLRKRYGNWIGQGPPVNIPGPGPIETRGVEALLFTEAGAPDTIQLSWVSPPVHSPDTLENRRREAIQRLALAVLNHRLADRTTGEDAPFTSAGAFQADQFGAARVTSLIIGVTPEHWREGLAAADQVQRRAMIENVSTDELTAARASVDAAFREVAVPADSRESVVAADMVTASLAAGQAATSPSQDLALFDRATSEATADQVTAALRELFIGQGPLIFMSSPDPLEGGKETLAAAYTSAHAAPITAPVAARPAAAPFEAFGEIGRQADRRDLIDLDTVFVRFENGVRLTIKPTKLKDDEVRVKVRVGGDVAAPDWVLTALVDGGPVKIANERGALALSAATSREDLEDTLRTLAGPILKPALQPEAFEKARKAALERYDHDQSSADGVLARDLPALLNKTTASLSDRKSIETMQPDQTGGQIGAAMRSGSLEVIIVGDVTIEKALDAVAATFAALPRRPMAPIVTGEPAPPPYPAASATPQTLVHNGKPDDGAALMAWRTDSLLADPREARTVQVLAAVLQQRLTDSGLSAKASDDASLTGSPWGDLTIIIDAIPETLQWVTGEAGKIAGDLRARDVSAEELQRARTTVSLKEATARRSNAHWLDLLQGAQEDVRRLAVIRSQDAAVERVTAADIRAAAQRYLRDDSALKVMVRPAGS
jgi:zinc protease